MKIAPTGEQIGMNQTFDVEFPPESAILLELVRLDPSLYIATLIDVDQLVLNGKWIGIVTPVKENRRVVTKLCPRSWF